jgi:hypothetical protein
MAMLMLMTSGSIWMPSKEKEKERVQNSYERLDKLF